VLVGWRACAQRGAVGVVAVVHLSSCHRRCAGDSSATRGQRASCRAHGFAREESLRSTSEEQRRLNAARTRGRRAVFWALCRARSRSSTYRRCQQDGPRPARPLLDMRRDALCGRSFKISVDMRLARRGSRLESRSAAPPGRRGCGAAVFFSIVRQIRRDGPFSAPAASVRSTIKRREGASRRCSPYSPSMPMAGAAGVVTCPSVRPGESFNSRHGSCGCRRFVRVVGEDGYR